ncbi:MAG: 23S rRNA (adenine(2030)-N(6))-methyltransferase RlmJ [Alphaproteobacteria bacterium]|nr:23S rRNA (adenine(2030)-N(6))-methyltransferase RlmJ [Alphaproteobacteria bacterium]
MNYRHRYHAGGFHDVLKHTVLALLIEALKRKDTPFCALDTHAGIGLYDLRDEAAEKTGEAADGVLRLAGQVLPFELGPYWAAVKSVNQRVKAGALRWYPGSPRLLRALMREGDRLLLAELHPEDAATLRAEFAGEPGVTVREMDGYTALKALLPPEERRGVVLIDPPFEAKDEFVQLQRGLADAWRRWPTGVYAIWYPIKGCAPVDAFHAFLKQHAPAETFAAELRIHDGYSEAHLNGCGMAVVNPPWKVDEQVANVLPFLHRTLARSGGGSELNWLVREKDRA